MYKTRYVHDYMYTTTYVEGYTCSRLHMYTTTAVQDCTCSRLHLHTTTYVQDCTCTRLHLYTTTAVQNCTCSRLHMYTTTAVQDCTCSRLHLHTTTAVQNYICTRLHMRRSRRSHSFATHQRREFVRRIELSRLSSIFWAGSINVFFESRQKAHINVFSHFRLISMSFDIFESRQKTLISMSLTHWYRLFPAAIPAKHPNQKKMGWKFSWALPSSICARPGQALVSLQLERKGKWREKMCMDQAGEGGWHAAASGWKPLRLPPCISRLTSDVIFPSLSLVLDPLPKSSSQKSHRLVVMYKTHLRVKHVHIHVNVRCTGDYYLIYIWVDSRYNVRWPQM